MYKTVIDKENSQKLPLEIEAHKLFDFEDQKILKLELKPGDKVEKHKNDWRIIFYILEGSGTLHIDDSTFSMSQGQSIAIPPGSERGWENNSNDKLLFLGIKSPAK